MDYHVLAYLIAISIGTGLLFGLAPALRLSKLDINAALKDGGHGATGGGRRRHLSSIFVTGQIVLAVVLLAGAGVMIRSFLHIYTAGVGVNPANVLMTFVVLPDAEYSRPAAQISFFDRLITRLEAIPGVESIAVASSDPTGGSLTFPYELAGDPPVDEQGRPKLSALVISPAYFRAVGAAILLGRQFNDADGGSGVPVVIVNQRFAGKYWPGENPLGKRLRLFDGKMPQAWLTVVGVASDILQNDGTRQEIDPLVYLPYRQKPREVMVVIARTRVAPGSLGTAFWREIQATESNLPIYEFFTLDERLKWNYRDSGNFAVLFLIFAAIALLLASVGLYAVIAHSVSQRTQEIGIRMAVGATSRDVLNLVFKEGMLPLGIGLAIGLIASLAVNRVLKAQLVHVSPTDPITLLIASGTLILAALLGCWIPARRAMRVDPVIALRHE
jgi:putative ABC transport system permease protein